jgi:hypothetical protein
MSIAQVRIFGANKNCSANDSKNSAPKPFLSSIN